MVAIGAGYVNLAYVVPYIGNELVPGISKDLIAIASQFTLGFILASTLPRYWLLFSCLTGALPLTFSIYGIISKLEEHNLWPLEIFFGLVFIGPAIAGAAVAWYVLRSRLQKIEKAG